MIDPVPSARTASVSGISRRGLLCGAAALGGAALLAGCGARAGKAEALRVSITGKGEADNRLLFAAAGLTPDFPVAWSEFESGHLVVEALNSGALDFGGMSEIPPVFAAASTVQSFREIGVYHGDVNNQVVLVPKGSRIASLADLKGKRVGYVRATTTQYFLIKMLKSVGLSWADITPVAMSVADGAAAFSHGALDAWAIYGFPIQRAVANDGARILSTALGFLSGNYIITAHNDAIADPVRADWIGRYLRLTRKGYAWAAANQPEWARIVAKEIGVPVADVEDQFRRKSDNFSLRPVSEEAIRSQQEVADVFTGAGLLPRRVDVRPLWNTTFNHVLKEA
ncbi:ABC transporter substrate-binding protein [Novosphingobium sp. KCTC 2891]|uniref:ABC transporter substrate-binding protein n=1 Tax=Novosphingobium sp. KCTC 2891 TaxID=2989730 RepID=UPI0022214405|nr:ABC transporter substrate-binding protein [Novosphingobium sp. KCTC 2891]MCW1383565.1 ABC transporter substrate-binding protein [Novosphingobium sp. KCTC 2891]